MKKQTVSVEELAITNMYEIEGLIRVLVNKRLITPEEVLEEIRVVQKEHIQNKEKIGKT